MDVLDALASIKLLADIRLAGDLVSLITPGPHQDWRRNPIILEPGWLDLVGDMLTQLTCLPARDQPAFKYIRAIQGKLEVSWIGDADQSDMIIIATQARAEHKCQWCGVRGRYDRLRQLTVCATHAALVRQKKVDNIALAERLVRGEPFPKRRMLVDLIVGRQTQSGLAAALATENDEHGFNLSAAHLPAGWFCGTAAEADLYAIDAARVGNILDYNLFGALGAARSFQVQGALPIISEAADLFDVAPTEINELIRDASHFDPQIRVPAFLRLARLIQALDEREAEKVRFE